MIGEMKIITSNVNEVLLHEQNSESESQVALATCDVKQKFAKLLDAIDIKTEYLRVAKIIFEVDNYLRHSLSDLHYLHVHNVYPSTVNFHCELKDRCLISLVILSEFKQINNFPFPLKSS